MNPSTLVNNRYIKNVMDINICICIVIKDKLGKYYFAFGDNNVINNDEWIERWTQGKSRNQDFREQEKGDGSKINDPKTEYGRMSNRTRDNRSKKVMGSTICALQDDHAFSIRARKWLPRIFFPTKQLEKECFWRGKPTEADFHDDSIIGERNTRWS